MRLLLIIFTQLALVIALQGSVWTHPKNKAHEGIRAEELRSWLTHFSSDQFEGELCIRKGWGLRPHTWPIS